MDERRLHRPDAESMPLPAGLVERWSGPGATEGERRWLDGLRHQAADLLEAWALRLDGAPYDSSAGWVAPVRTADGLEAVAKIGLPHEDAADEVDGLRAFDGKGAVRVLRSSDDGWSMLLERCQPGTPVVELPVGEGIAVAATVLRELWRAVPAGSPFRSLRDIALRWSAELPAVVAGEGYDTDTIAAGMAAARQLAESQPAAVLLHGDLNPYNVVSAQRRPWLAIDCKPVVGDPAYDTAQYLGNLTDMAFDSRDPLATMAGFADGFARPLSLDPARVMGWAFVKSLGWTWAPPAVELFRRGWETRRGVL